VAGTWKNKFMQHNCKLHTNDTCKARFNARETLKKSGERRLEDGTYMCEIIWKCNGQRKFPVIRTLRLMMENHGMFLLNCKFKFSYFDVDWIITTATCKSFIPTMHLLILSGFQQGNLFIERNKNQNQRNKHPVPRNCWLYPLIILHHLPKWFPAV